MNTNPSFSLNRVRYLLMRDVLVDLRLTLNALLVILGILTLFFCFHLFDPISDMRYFHEPAYLVLMFAGGTLFISSIFSELSTVERRHVYLSIPATSFEKFLSKWVIASIFIPVLLTLLYCGFSFLANSFFNFTRGVEAYPFDLRSDNNKMTIRVYYIVQSLFFLGAIIFNRFTFLKTGATIFVTGGFIFLAFWSILFLIVGAESLQANWIEFPLYTDIDIMLSDNEKSYLPYWYKRIAVLGITTILPIITTIIAYFKLKEKTV